MQFNVIGGVQVAEKLDQDDDLEFIIECEDGLANKWLTKSEAEDLADHILKVLRETQQ